MGVPAEVVWDESLLAYDMGDEHPLNPIRLQLTMRLATALGERLGSGHGRTGRGRVGRVAAFLRHGRRASAQSDPSPVDHAAGHRPRRAVRVGTWAYRPRSCGTSRCFPTTWATSIRSIRSVSS